MGNLIPYSPNSTAIVRLGWAGVNGASSNRLGPVGGESLGTVPYCITRPPSMLIAWPWT